MENHDKLYELFQKAAEHPTEKDFPAMDKVWARVEEKLDKKELRKENSLWKKIAIAASLLLIFTLGYQLITTDELPTKENNQVVVSDSIQPSIIRNNTEVVTTSTSNPEIKKDAEVILNKQINAQQVAVNDAVSESANPAVVYPASAKMDAIEKQKEAPAKQQSATEDQKTHDIEVMVNKNEGKSVTRQDEPLVVVDGKAVSKTGYDARIKKDLSNLNSENTEELVVLNEPLYIINGKEYTEQELFGENPTSPYAPLNKQEIESISVLQGAEAKPYGDKGKKGVVIITTKGRKPARK